jgi:hypothetical protein
MAQCDAWLEIYTDDTAGFDPDSPFTAFRVQQQQTDEDPLSNTPEPPDPSLDSMLHITVDPLLRHYCIQVARVMMPFEHRCNPWQTVYPAAALAAGSADCATMEHGALYNAIMAHAATHLSQLGCGSHEEAMQIKAARHYDIAVRELQNSIENEHRDYGTFMAAIMAIMTIEVRVRSGTDKPLCISELISLLQVFRGQSNSWRTHIRGAWSFIRGRDSAAPWGPSELALSSTQWFFATTILSETPLPSIPETPASREKEKVMLDHMFACKRLGYTFGATQPIMTCIADIKRLKYRIRSGGATIESIAYEINGLQHRLGQVRASESVWPMSNTSSTTDHVRDDDHSRYHVTAFKHATYIYLYRELFDDVPPQSLMTHISAVFDQVRAYSESGGTNFSTWPVFMAAVEAYEPVHIDIARQWLSVSLAHPSPRRSLGR